MATLALMFYVYELIDPRDGSVFYVGKGKGNRVRQHAANTNRGVVDNAEKFARIQAIHAAGLKVGERFVSWHESEAEAFKAERGHIARQRESLTNIVGGSVTNEEATREKAKWALGRMKTYERWMAEIRPHQLAAVGKHAGGARGFYDGMRNFYQEVATGA